MLPLYVPVILRWLSMCESGFGIVQVSVEANVFAAGE